MFKNFHFSIVKIFTALFFFLIFTPKYTLASYEADFPSLAMGSEGSIEQIQTALRGVHSSGKLLVIPSKRTDPRWIAQEISKLSPEDKDRIIILNSEKEYLWIRDTSTQWRRLPNSKWALRRDADEPNTDFTAIMNLCTNAEFGELPRPTHENAEGEDKNLGAGGNVLNDGGGNCAVGDSAGWNDYKRKLYKKEFKCKNLIRVPIDQWPHHPNKHADLMISFIGPGIALIPQIPQNCNDEMSIGYRSVSDETEKRAKQVGIEVYRVEVDGCPSKIFERMHSMSSSLIPSLRRSIAG